MSEPRSVIPSTPHFEQPTPRTAIPVVFGSGVPLLAYAVPVAVVSILAWTVYAVTLPAGVLVISNGAFVEIEPPGRTALPAVLLGLAVALAHAFGLAAATGAILARLRGTTIGVADAWSFAARRPLRILVGALGVAVASAVAVGLVLISVAAGLPLFVGGLVALVLACVLSPLALAWPLAIASTGGPLAAGVGAWRLHRSVHAKLAVRSPLLLTLVPGVLVLAGLNWLLRFAPQNPVASALSIAVVALAGSAVTLVLLGVVCALVVEALERQGRPDALRAVDGRIAAPQIAHPATPQTTPSTTRPSPRRGLLLAAVAVVGAPAVLALGAVAVNPTGAPRVASAESNARWDSLQSAALDDGGTVTISSNAGAYNDLALCAATVCEPRVDLAGPVVTSVASLDAGRVLSARWNVEEDSDGARQSVGLEVTVSRAADLDALAADHESDAAAATLPGTTAVIDTVENADPENLDFTPDTFSRNVHLAIDTTGALPVIVSVDWYSGPSTLRVYRCTDAVCSDATVQETPLTWRLFSEQYSAVDLATAPDGTAFVSVISDDDSAPALRLFRAPTAGTIEAASLVDDPGAGADELEHATQVAVDDSGTASVLYWAGGDTGTQLFRCIDADCSDWDTVDVSPNTAQPSSSAMVIDSTGRPVIAAMDDDRDAVVLRSCTDAECSSFEDRSIAAAGSATATVVLTLDADDHPVVSVADSDRHFADGSGTIRVYRCADARCGAE